MEPGGSGNEPRQEFIHPLKSKVIDILEVPEILKACIVSKQCVRFLEVYMKKFPLIFNGQHESACAVRWYHL